MKPPSSLLRLGALVALSAPAAAQPGANPNIDVSLGGLEFLTNFGRTGVFPNGTTGFSMETTSCNLMAAPNGINVPWLTSMGTPTPGCTNPMDRRHPTIAFLAARYTASQDRLVQISDRSYLKHGFFALSDTICGPCPAGSPGTWLALQCSDTYGISNNSDHVVLGPPDELNPWTGVWSPCGSHFDRGEPPVAPAQQTDGARSLSAAQAAALAPISHVVRVRDSELNVPGSLFYYQAQYVISSWTQVSTTVPVPNPAATVGLLLNEPDAARTNNLGSRPFSAVWNGASWTIFNPFAAILHGSILQRWPGAAVASNTNGADDGRIYVAVKVTGPSPTTGLFHYEYAVHNRDNARAVGVFRIPTCPGTQVSNLFFRDIDDVGSNDWTPVANGTEVAFTAPAGNELRWNTVFNFAFDADASAGSGASLLDQAFAGPGSAQVSVTTTVPANRYNPVLGAGCGIPTAPLLFALGTPPQASIPNASLALRTTGNPAGAAVGLLLYLAPGQTALGGGCTAYGANPSTLDLFVTTTADPTGAATFATPVPNDPSLEGLSVDAQTVALAAPGPYLGALHFSTGVRVRLGNAIPGCP